MKKLIPGLIFLCMLSLVSCRTVLYSHEQVMDRYKTRQDVEKRFGIPNEKMVSDTAETWMYIYSPANFHHVYEQIPVGSTVVVDQFGKYKRYAVYAFDRRSNVVRWEANGIDLAERKVSAIKTIALVLGLSALIAGLAVIAANSISFGTYNSY